jgi:hypothetical protein
MSTASENLMRALKRCHERQFNGEDWQAAAIDACNELGTSDDEDFKFLSISPDPGCSCGFCATAPWRDE